VALNFAIAAFIFNGARPIFGIIVSPDDRRPDATPRAANVVVRTTTNWSGHSFHFPRVGTPPKPSRTLHDSRKDRDGDQISTPGGTDGKKGGLNGRLALAQ
jgi:hypothetical protein